MIIIKKIFFIALLLINCSHVNSFEIMSYFSTNYQDSIDKLQEKELINKAHGNYIKYFKKI
jgi:hypothetical protein